MAYTSSLAASSSSTTYSVLQVALAGGVLNSGAAVTQWLAGVKALAAGGLHAGEANPQEPAGAVRS